MAKNIPEAIDYSKLSLPEIIKRVAKAETDFLELDFYSQRLVLDFIQKHNINIKALGYKWYDILSNKFFAIEYLPSEEFFFDVVKKVREFDSFSDFFRFVQGGIYQNSCFYGYKFSNEEIKKFSINIQLLNFDSLIHETIDSHIFEPITDDEKARIEIGAKQADEICKWFKRIKSISTLKSLETKYNQFIQKFNFLSAKEIFFSMLLRKEKDLLKQAAIEFACKHNGEDGLTFDLILLAYGREVALYVMNHFGSDMTPRRRAKKKSKFKDQLEGYDSGTFVLRRTLGFDEFLQFYYVRDSYVNTRNHPLLSCNFFGDFSEFVSFVNGDLSNADLAKAPLSRDEVNKYKINADTKLPLSKQYDKYEVSKEYIGDKFVVRQKWVDIDGIVILEKEHSFARFFDFAHFLKGDLSGADLIFCDGIENVSGIPGLRLDGAKMRSEAAKKLGLPLQRLPKGKFKTENFPQTDKYELETIDNFLAERPEDGDYSGRVSYISDIHLLHRFGAYKCETDDDVTFVLRTIAKTLAEQASFVNLVGGDTSSDFGVFKAFVNDLSFHRKKGDFFFTLGNHELWPFPGQSLSSTVEKYETVLREEGRGEMHLVQNNIFYADNGWKKISEEELTQISSEDLRAKVRAAYVIIFGGIGFAGKNEEFNAINGIYGGALNRESEISESKKFFALYEKVTTALKGMNLIVLTHMPMKDWGGEDAYAKEGVVYVNGHSHRNYLYDDGKKRIYADNQIGYKGKRISFKQLSMNFEYAWFADYKDGIYEITREDYENFYRGIHEGINFKRKFSKLFMIKREDTYMFLMQTPKGTLVILNGGSIRKAGHHSLEYFYERLKRYSSSVKLFLSKYDEFQKKVSDEVKRFGGEGTIHGCIVDIDFYNHLYLNIRDGTITPYFAESMVDKYVYKNLASLLKYRCPNLLPNYEKMTERGDGKSALTILGDKRALVSGDCYYVEETDIYKDSRVVKGLQFTTKYSVVRLWNDALAADTSEENGKRIVLGLIDYNQVSQTEEQKNGVAKTKKKSASTSKETRGATSRKK